jgi:hypothetical protein
MVDKIWEDAGHEFGIIDDVSEYTPMSDEAVEKLALSIVRREVFGSWQITEQAPVTIEQVFIPLMLLDAVEVKRITRDGASHLWEYVDEAASTAINGYPIFFSGSFLDQTDFNRVMARVRTMEQVTA